MLNGHQKEGKSERLSPLQEAWGDLTTKCNVVLEEKKLIKQKTQNKQKQKKTKQNQKETNKQTTRKIVKIWSLVSNNLSIILVIQVH